MLIKDANRFLIADVISTHDTKTEWFINNQTTEHIFQIKKKLHLKAMHGMPVKLHTCMSLSSIQKWRSDM